MKESGHGCLQDSEDEMDCCYLQLHKPEQNKYMM